MAGWFVLAFGLLLVGLGVRAVVGERRAAARGRRPARPDVGASALMLFVLGGLALLLAAGIAFLFPR